MSANLEKKLRKAVKETVEKKEKEIATQVCDYFNNLPIIRRIKYAIKLLLKKL